MRFAVKRLRRSDLTLFDAQFRRQNAGNQKAINLNRDVFIDILYPLAIAAFPGETRFPCELRIYGPRAIAEPRVVMRKVLAAAGTQKNWRLNGETIVADPEAVEPDRYDNLEQGDIALFAFEGEVIPRTISLLLVSQSEAKDKALYSDLDGLLNGKRMVAASSQDLLPLLERIEDTHPFRELFDPALDLVAEEAAAGSAEAISILRTRGIVRNTHEALAKAKATFERVGRDGEGLVNEFLQQEIEAGRCMNAIWEAERNATHPFDFSAEFENGCIAIEVKSTTGEHERPVIISQAEIEYAATDKNVELWRVSRLANGGAVLRRAFGFHALALRLAQELWDGAIRPTGWSIGVGELAPWSGPIQLQTRFDNDSD